MSEELKLTEGVKISQKKAIAIFINLNISCLATSMLSTAMSTTLPPIMDDFHINVNLAQWITSGYELFLAVFTPMTAYLITKYKTKKLYLSAISFFILGLALCAISPNFKIMMVGRMIQACGNGLLNAMAQVIILAIFPHEKVGTMMGIYGISIGVSPVIAPSIAGFLIDWISWRMIFVSLIFVIGISLICAIIVFEDVLPTMKRDFDIISLIICTLTFGGTTFAISNYGVFDFTSCQVMAPLIIGILSGILFVWRQLHIKVPFLDVRVLKDKNLTISIILTFLLELIMMGSIMICPIYVQEVKGRSASISGLVIFPGALSMAVICPIAGTLYDKKGIKGITLIGSSISAIMNFILYFISFDQSIWLVAALNFIKCMSFGLHLMPLLSWGMRDIPKEKSSDANALFISLRCVGCSMGTALFVAIMSKVSIIVANDVEHPEMYGIDFTFLVMGVLALIMFFIALWGCDSYPSTYNKLEDEGKMEQMEVVQNSGYVKLEVDYFNEEITNKTNEMEKDENFSNENV